MAGNRSEEGDEGTRSEGPGAVAARLRRAGCPQSVCERMAHLERRGRLEEGVFELAAERDRLAREARRAEEGLACVDEVLLSIAEGTAKGRHHGS